MKKSLKFAAMALVGICAVQLASCSGGTGKSTLLGKPEAVQPLSYEERQDANTQLQQGAAEFAAKFASAVYENYDDGKNFAVSPVSVYMALSLAAECAADKTREELVSALGVSYETLQSEFADYYRSLIAEYEYDKKVTARVSLGNSIWIDNRATAKEDCVRSLAEKYFCYSYAADFGGDNENANLAVRKFVKDQTYGLIDQDFRLAPETMFALINTLYLKDIWNDEGEDLFLTEQMYDFTQKNGDVKQTKLLEGYYFPGRVYETETFRHFYTATSHGYRIKFLLPKEGYTVDDIFTRENLALVNSLSDYHGYDEENQIYYFTRCLFPEFEAEYNKDIKDILRSAFGIDALFGSGCDFSALTDDDVACEKVQHVTKLFVEKKGIEGAAVTVISMDASAAPPEHTEVYEDFIVNGAFGFILTDPYGNTLFSGAVNRL